MASGNGFMRLRGQTRPSEDTRRVKRLKSTPGLHIIQRNGSCLIITTFSNRVGEATGGRFIHQAAYSRLLA